MRKVFPVVNAAGAAERGVLKPPCYNVSSHAYWLATIDVNVAALGAGCGDGDAIAFPRDRHTHAPNKCHQVQIPRKLGQTVLQFKQLYPRHCEGFYLWSKSFCICLLCMLQDMIVHCQAVCVIIFCRVNVYVRPLNFPE